MNTKLRFEADWVRSIPGDGSFPKKLGVPGEKGIRCLSCIVCYALESILTPLSTLKGPITVSSMIPAQNMTPPLFCCRFILGGGDVPWRIHPDAHASGPSRVARHLLVHRMVEKSLLMFCRAQSSLNSLCRAVRQGFPTDLLTFPNSPSTLLRDDFRFMGTPADSNISLLVPRVCFAIARFSLVFSRAVTLSWLSRLICIQED